MGNEELYIARRHRDFVNRFAVALAHFDIDLATAGANELKLVLPICCFRADLFAAGTGYVPFRSDPGITLSLLCLAIRFDDGLATRVSLGKSRHQLGI